MLSYKSLSKSFASSSEIAPGNETLTSESLSANVTLVESEVTLPFFYRDIRLELPY